VDGSRPRESKVESVCHYKSSMFSSAHVALDVFILRHPVIYWGWGVWHVIGGGDSGRGHHACVRRGKGDKGRSGRGCWCPDEGLIIINVREGDWGRSSGGSSVYV